MKVRMPEWKRRIIEKLKKREKTMGAAELGRKRIEIIDSRMTALRGGGFDSIPVKGGTSNYENRLLDCIMEKADIEAVIIADENEAMLIDDALLRLSPEEKRLLDLWLFGGGIRRCEQEFNYGDTVLYARIDDALRKLAYAFCDYTEIG